MPRQKRTRPPAPQPEVVASEHLPSASRSSAELLERRQWLKRPLDQDRGRLYYRAALNRRVDEGAATVTEVFGRRGHVCGRLLLHRPVGVARADRAQGGPAPERSDRKRRLFREVQRQRGRRLLQHPCLAASW